MMSLDEEAIPLLVQQQLIQQQHRKYSLRSVALVFSVPALGGCLFGYDIGATSYAIAQLQREWHPVATSAVLQGTIVSTASLGALIGSFAMMIFSTSGSSRTTTTTTSLGRKLELQLGAVLYLLGAAVQASSILAEPSPSLQQHEESSWILPLATLLLGRLIYGLGIGISMHAAPVYISENGPAAIRGLLVSLKEASIVLGILLGYILGLTFFNIGSGGGWARAYACSIVLSTTMMTLSFVIPESCRWLLLQGRDDEAREALRFVYNTGNTSADDEYVNEEFAAMHQALEAECATTSTSADSTSETPATTTSAVAAENATSVYVLWKNPSYRAPLVAGVGLVVLQQITGQPSVLSYAATIFRKAGLADSSSIFVAAFKLAMTLLAAATVEAFGRKKLLYTGCVLMMVALVSLSASLGASFAGNETIVLLSMFLYIGGYQVGFGPISWLMVSEVFPLSVRGQAVAVAVQVNFFMNFVVQFGVPVLEDLAGLNVTFCGFAILTAYSIYFVKRNVPETKGLTLEEIERQFRELTREHDRSGGDIETERVPLLVDDAH